MRDRIYDDIMRVVENNGQVTLPISTAASTEFPADCHRPGGFDCLGYACFSRFGEGKQLGVSTLTGLVFTRRSC